MVCVEAQQFPEFLHLRRRRALTTVRRLGQVAVRRRGLGRFDMFEAADNRTESRIPRRTIKTKNSLTPMRSVVEPVIVNPREISKIENSLTQRSAEWSLFGLGCQFSQHWPRGDEVVVGERFFGPSLVAGDLVEEIGELAGSIAYAA